MSTTPPEQPGTSAGGGTHRPGGYGMPNITGGARMPIPGNAEFLFWILLLIFLAIVVAIADTLNVNDWFQATVFTAIAYILSRGVAKASRVLEQ
jgi:uncharacterized membrane protein